MKIRNLVVITVCIFIIFSCSGFDRNGNYISTEISTDSLDNKVIIWDGKIYHYWGIVKNGVLSLRGKQIGIVNGNKQHKIYELKGYDSNEWLFEYYNRSMTTYSILYNQEKVRIIPEKLLKKVHDFYQLNG